jgi:hypothetical protein
MRILIFKSQKRNGLHAFALADGGDLPKQHGPWHAVGVIRSDRDPPYNLRRDVIERSISDVGFQLFKVSQKQQDAS